MKLFTIGFTQKTAKQFFGLLEEVGVRRVLDIRLNNRSQLAGFSKADDLPFFLDAIAGIGYRYAGEMAPTQAIIDGFRKSKSGWSRYEKQYIRLLDQRDVAASIDRSELSDACLLCSEHEPAHCHRRLAAEHLQQHIGKIEIVHLK